MSPRVVLLTFVLAAMVLATASSPRLYEWTVKYEHTAPESSKMLSITINGQSPGPIISVYQADKFIVDLTNGLGNENLEIQWEGVRQIGEAQGPVLPGNTTRFQFVADQLGTNSYYAVSKLQRVAGLQGSIQVLPQPIEGKEGVPFAEGADQGGQG